jgi:hypothetical protein
MKSLYHALLLAILLPFAACQKEVSEDLPDSPKPTNKVKTYTEDYTSSTGERTIATFVLSYDESDRLASIVDSEHPGDKFVYGYPGDNLVTTDIYNSNEVVIHDDAVINETGLVDSTVQYNNEGDTLVQKFFYSEAKQLIAVQLFDVIDGEMQLWSATTYTYDQGGNLVSEAGEDGIITYEYEKIIPNTVAVAPTYMYLPKQLPTKQTITNGSETASIVHTYVFDEENRLTEDKAVASDGSMVIKTYTY